MVREERLRPTEPEEGIVGGQVEELSQIQALNMHSIVPPKEKAGVVAYRYANGREPILLVLTSRKFKGSWIFPVGTVKRGESLDEAAKRECAEEAGYYVEVGSRLPPFEVSVGNGTVRYSFFLATVVGIAPQRETDRKRDWLPLSGVMERLALIFHPVARDAVELLAQQNSTQP